MAKPGSHEHAADRAARGAVEAGLTPLEAKLVVHIASRGLDWQNDSEIREEIERPDGKPYHPESIGRVRRDLARRGFISSRRLMPGQPLPNRAKYGRTSSGTTLKHVIWSAFRQATPTPRGARTRERQRLRREERQRRPSLPSPLSPAETLTAIAEARRRIDGG